jgi:hypothetical protein
MSKYINIPPSDPFLSMFSRGADIGDADTTLQPFTDRAWFYVLPANTLTANRVITLGNTNFYNSAGMFLWVGILRYDTGAFTLRINNTAGAQIYLDPASPAPARLLVFACTNAGVWVSSQYIWHMRAP